MDARTRIRMLRLEAAIQAEEKWEGSYTPSSGKPETAVQAAVN